MGGILKDRLADNKPPDRRGKRVKQAAGRLSKAYGVSMVDAYSDVCRLQAMRAHIPGG
jgi:hypothetical protein